MLLKMIKFVLLPINWSKITGIFQNIFFINIKIINFSSRRERKKFAKYFLQDFHTYLFLDKFLLNVMFFNLHFLNQPEMIRIVQEISRTKSYLVLFVKTRIDWFKWINLLKTFFKVCSNLHVFLWIFSEGNF